MSPGINFDPSAASLQRAELRVSPTPGMRLLNRLSATRNSNTAGDVAPAGNSAAEEARAAVVRAHPSAAAGDMLDTLPDEESARRPGDPEKKKIDLPLIHSRLEVQLLCNTRKARAAYNTEDARRPQVDIRV